MTELDLQDAVAEALKNEILPKISVFEPDEVKVYKHDIPFTEDYEDEDEDKHFPCCIVRLRAGEIKTAADPQRTTTEILVVVKDDDEYLSGYESLIILIQRIRDHFMEQQGIYGKFRLEYPVKWGVNDEVALPYYVGNVILIWDTAVMPFRDPMNFL